MRTAQELFDIIVAHLRAQGSKALNGNECCYRTPDGKKCAIGCLIPDSIYSNRMECKDFLTISRLGFFENCLDLKEEIRANTDLLGGMQIIHDQHPVSSWEVKFSALAARRELLYSPPVTKK